MQLLSLIKKNKLELIDFLKKEIKLLRNEFETEKVPSLEIINFFEKYLYEGKYLRSFLIDLFFNGYVDRSNKEKINSLQYLKGALEVFHTSILIHDDVFDNDYLRRGKPTAHYYYNQLLKEKPDHQNGKNLAIILGDFGFYLSNYLFYKSVYYFKNYQKITNIFNLQILKTALAEMSDVKNAYDNQELSLKKIEKINQYKTSEYTFTLPFLIGYLASDLSDEDEIVLIKKIGVIMGQIYQITDDLLNFVGTEDETGKSIGTDIRENKKTLIRYLLYKKADDKDRKLFNQFFGKKINQKGLNLIKKRYFDLKIDKEINHLIKKKQSVINSLIDNLKINKNYKKLLKELIDFISQRNQ